MTADATVSRVEALPLTCMEFPSTVLRFKPHSEVVEILKWSRNQPKTSLMQISKTPNHLKSERRLMQSSNPALDAKLGLLVRTEETAEC